MVRTGSIMLGFLGSGARQGSKTAPARPSGPLPASP